MKVQKYVNSMQRLWNSTVIRHMHVQLAETRPFLLLLFADKNKANNLRKYL